MGNGSLATVLFGITYLPGTFSIVTWDYNIRVAQNTIKIIINDILEIKLKLVFVKTLNVQLL